MLYVSGIFFSGVTGFVKDPKHIYRNNDKIKPIL